MKRTRTTLDFDELNELDEFRELEKQVKKAKKSRGQVAIPYEDYFGKMFISPEEMDERIGLATQIEEVMLYVFAYWIVIEEVGLSIDELRQDVIDKLLLIVARHTKVDEYLETHIQNVVSEVLDTTAKHMDEKESEDSEYWLSRDRAMIIAENEANSIENYVEYRDAAISGKTTKRWITELDDKVRLTHEIAEGQTVDIDGLFLVGDSLMRFPKDTMYDADPKETINCRCSVVYE